MSYIELIIILIVILFISIWALSEVLLFKSITKSKKDSSIWLVLNIILPVVGYVIYKLTHNVSKER